MANENYPIEIMQMRNGFIVMPRRSLHRDEAMLFEEQHVFRTMAELLNFIAAHFDHRDIVDHQDSVKKVIA